MTSNSTDRRHGVNGSLAIKAPCKSATTANITLSGEQTLDGVALVSGDRALVKNQTAGSENGIYAVNTSDWQREPDWDGVRDAVEGTSVYVTDGDATTGHWRVTTANPITPGTTSVAFIASDIDSTLRSDLVSTDTDDGTSGFHLVSIPPFSTETNIENHAFAHNNALRYILLSLHDGIRAGTNTTNLATYINNAITSVSATAKGSVVFPAGTYYTTAAIILEASISIIGDGQNATIFDGQAGTHNIFEGIETSQTAYRSSLKDCKILGNTTGDNIKLDGVSYLHIDRIDSVYGVNGITFITDCFLNKVTNSLIELATGYGINLDDSGANFNVNEIRNNQFNGNVKVHIYVGASACYGNVISGNNFNAGGEALYATNGSYSNIFRNNSIEVGSSLTQSVYIGNLNYAGGAESAPINWTITDNNFTGAGTPTYQLRITGGAAHMVVENNEFNGVPGTSHIRLESIGGACHFIKNKNPSAGVKPIYTIDTVTNANIVSAVTTVLTFADEATSPSIMPDQGNGNTGKVYKTANTVATSLTSVAEAMDGQEYKVIFGDSNTTVLFGGAGAFLGNVGVNWTPATNDHMDCIYDATLAKSLCVISDNTA